jgi:protein required for attachment to host cells
MPKAHIPETHIAHAALVLIGDGEKALFLRNEGGPRELKLVVERILEQDNPASREQGTDRPGRVSSSVGARRSAIEETDWHQLGEDRFAAEIADTLYRVVHEDRDTRIVVVAPPKTMGELRKAFHPEVAACIAAEIPKELTTQSLPDIEKVLAS